VEINKAWETIRENISISAKERVGYYELKKNKPWFEEGCSKSLDQRKQAKLQCLQNRTEVNGDNQNNIRGEASRHFRNKKSEYLKNKFNELAQNSKNKNIRDLYRGINDLKRTNLVKDENGDLLADSHNILNRWKYYTLLLNVHRVSHVRQIEIRIAEPIVPDPSLFEVEIAIAKLKSPAEFTQARGEILCSKIHKLINYIWNKEKLPDQWKESIILLVHKKGDKTDCSNYRGISLLSTLYKILSNILLSRLIPYIDEMIGDHQCGFRRNRSTTDHIFAFIRSWIKNGTVRQYISYS
jgi:hypothetical protein